MGDESATVDLSSLEACQIAVSTIVDALIFESPDDARTRAYSAALKGLGMVIGIHERNEDRELARMAHEELNLAREERNAALSAGAIRASKAHPDLGGQDGVGGVS